MSDARTYAEAALLTEIERALKADDTYVLRILDRLRDAAGLPADGRVIDALHRRPDILPTKKGRAA